MTPLRRRMIEDMQIRRFAPATQYSYIRCVTQFAEFYGRSPEQLGLEEVRKFLVHLVNEAQVSYGALRGFVSALRFLYKVTLHKPWDVADIPYPQREKRLPRIPSRDDLVEFLTTIPNIKHRAVLMTCYGAGLRVSEAVRLQVRDLDSRRMVIHVQLGKRRKDRVIPLAPALLVLLRAYYRAVRPGVWLFPGRYGHHLSIRAVQSAFLRAQERARLPQHLTVHTLRHAFATHLLDAGADLRAIQRLLGHACIQSTAIYTHVSTRVLEGVPNPLDAATAAR